MKYATKSDVIKAARLSESRSYKKCAAWILAHTQPIAGLVAVDQEPSIARSDRGMEAMRAHRRASWHTRIDRRADRVAVELGLPSAATLCATAAAGLRAQWPFRKSESAWAGGEHYVTVRVGSTPGAGGSTERAWSRNGKWSGTNSFATLVVTLGALRHFPTLRTPDGSVILHAEPLAPREYKLVWVEQSRGVDLKAREGYLIRGYHVAASSLKAARSKARAARQRALTVTLAGRQERIQVRRVYVDLEDSYRAGNCHPMSDQYAQQIWRRIGAAGPCAVRADVILADRADLYTRRAITAAAARV